jgi:hypothetical protein
MYSATELSLSYKNIFNKIIWQNEHMKFTIQLSPDDYVYASQLHSKLAIRLSIGLLIVPLFFAWYLWYLGVESPVVPIFFGVWIINFFLWQHLFMPQQTRKIFQQQKKLLQPHEYEITENGLSVTGGEDHTSYVWSHFLRWKGDENIILIYLSDAMFLMSPKKSASTAISISCVRIKRPILATS